MPERPYAVCPSDGEPLMSTLEFPGAEFFCQVCGRKVGFLSAAGADPTPVRKARHDELRAMYDVERAARQRSKMPATLR